MEEPSSWGINNQNNQSKSARISVLRLSCVAPWSPMGTVSRASHSSSCSRTWHPRRSLSINRERPNQSQRSGPVATAMSGEVARRDKAADGDATGNQGQGDGGEAQRACSVVLTCLEMHGRGPSGDLCSTASSRKRAPRLQLRT